MESSPLDGVARWSVSKLNVNGKCENYIGDGKTKIRDVEHVASLFCLLRFKF